MKRLFQISFDTLLVSVLSILLWVLLGLILDKEITYVFTLTNPIQFLFLIFISLFAIGPNITAKKYNNKSVVNSNMLLGLLIVGLITLVLILNIDKYITIMNMDKLIYHNFTIYSIIFMYFNFIIQLVTFKLYYDNKNNISNKINLVFNLSNFILILLLTLVTRNQVLSIALTLFIDLIIVAYFFRKHYSFTILNFKIKDNIKFTSFELLKNIGMLITYVVGYKTVFSYGSNYIAAINLEMVTTDAQWDILGSVDTAAKIDLAKNEFNYKRSLKNAYKLIALLIMSTVVMNIILYNYYKPNLAILVIILSIQFADMLIKPLKDLRIAYLQVNVSNFKHNFFYIISRVLRALCSFIPSAFCTYIGQVVAMIYLFIYSKLACRKVDLFKKIKIIE